MSDEGNRERRSSGVRAPGGGCGIGCGTFIFVFIVGGILSLFSTDFGIGFSVRVPFTQSNVTIAGSIGAKDKVISGLPGYTKDRVAGNQNFLNGTQTVTVGPAEGALVFVIGKQPGSPAIDLHLVLR